MIMLCQRSYEAVMILAMMFRMRLGPSEIKSFLSTECLFHLLDLLATASTVSCEQGVPKRAVTAPESYDRQRSREGLWPTLGNATLAPKRGVLLARRNGSSYNCPLVSHLTQAFQTKPLTRNVINHAYLLIYVQLAALSSRSECQVLRVARLFASIPTQLFFACCRSS